MTCYFCIYQGRIGPQTSFLVPIEEKKAYKAKLEKEFEILIEYEVQS